MLITVVALLFLTYVHAKCPNLCSGHGLCGTSNICTCFDGWTGGAADCSFSMKTTFASHHTKMKLKCFYRRELSQRDSMGRQSLCKWCSSSNHRMFECWHMRQVERCLSMFQRFHRDGVSTKWTPTNYHVFATFLITIISQANVPMIAPDTAPAPRSRTWRGSTAPTTTAPSPTRATDWAPCTRTGTRTPSSCASATTGTSPPTARKVSISVLLSPVPQSSLVFCFRSYVSEGRRPAHHQPKLPGLADGNYHGQLVSAVW